MNAQQQQQQQQQRQQNRALVQPDPQKFQVNLGQFPQNFAAVTGSTTKVKSSTASST
jgi:hypothetical protein